MLSVLFPRIALRATTASSRVILPAFTRPTPLSKIVTPVVTRTFLSSAPNAEPTKATEKPKTTKSTGAKRTKVTTLKKPAAKKKPVAKKKASANAPKKKAELKKAATPKIKIGDYKPPKRPMSGYLRFAVRRREAEGLKLTSLEQAREYNKKLGAEWKAMSDADKKPYLDEYLAAVPEYNRQREEYFKALPAAVFKEINKRRTLKGNKKMHRFGPRAPAGPFIRFSEGVRLELKNASTGSESNQVIAVSRAAGEKWRNMSAADKEPYFAAYRLEREAWNAKQKAAAEAS